MTQIPILQGVYSDSTASFRQSLPINLEAFVIDTGISKGYLGTAPGIVALGEGPGADRGSFTWEGVCYRVMGSKLVSVSQGGTVTELGSVGDNGKPVSFDNSFDRMAVASNENLFYYTPTEGVTQVTDPDLGIVLDVLFIDGRFMTTDGEFLVLTDLNDPYAIDPLRYGSAEVSPDPIRALKRIRGEVYALGSDTIENFRNVGGAGFPYQRNSGALIPKGTVGTHASAYFAETFAFVGGAPNEAPSVYLAGSGQADPIGTSEIDYELSLLSAEELAAVELESRREQDDERLYVHLPTKTLVFYGQASKAAGQPIWGILCDGLAFDQAYPARHMARAYGKWMVGTSDGLIGNIDATIETRFGETVGWQCDTVFLYNESRYFIVHEVELVGLPGRMPLGEDARVFMSTTQDGQTYGNERAVSAGTQGQRRKRVVWRPNRKAANYLSMRFRGADTAMTAWARLEARIEPLG